MTLPSPSRPGSPSGSSANDCASRRPRGPSTRTLRRHARRLREAQRRCPRRPDCPGQSPCWRRALPGKASAPPAIADMVRQHAATPSLPPLISKRESIELETLLASDAPAPLSPKPAATSKLAFRFAAYIDLAVKPEWYRSAHSIVTDRVPRHPRRGRAPPAAWPAARRTLAPPATRAKQRPGVPPSFSSRLRCRRLACIFVFMLVRRLPRASLSSFPPSVRPLPRSLDPPAARLQRPDALAKRGRTGVGRRDGLPSRARALLTPALLNNQGSIGSGSAISDAETHASSAPRPWKPPPMP